VAPFRSNVTVLPPRRSPAVLVLGCDRFNQFCSRGRAAQLILLMSVPWPPRLVS